MKIIINIRILLLFPVLLIFLISCSYSGINNDFSTNQGNEGLQIISVETVTSANSNNMQTSPTPAVSPEHSLSDLTPVSGSIMRWMDLSFFLYMPAGNYDYALQEPSQTEISSNNSVSLTGYWLQKELVSNQQYGRCVKEGRCTLPAESDNYQYRFESRIHENEPVAGINWYQAQDYCQFIGARLPTETEWEAASSSIVSIAFRNDFNEWVNDWYSEVYPLSSSTDNPTGPENGNERVIRGISNTPDQERFRLPHDPGMGNPATGFRCVLSVDLLQMAIAPSCYLLPINSSFPNESTSTPRPNLPATILTSCKYEGSTPVISLVIENPSGMTLHSFLVDQEPIDCKRESPSDYHCSSDKIFQGQIFQLNYCEERQLRFIDKKCLQGYLFNQKSNLCEIEIDNPQILTNDDEPIDNPSMDYFPAPDELTSECPIGYYLTNSNPTNRCNPVFNCYQSNTCQTIACVMGESYNSEKGCCIPVDEIQPYCQPEYSYDTAQRVCVNSTTYPFTCIETQIVASNCINRSTATATSTPYQEPESINTPQPATLDDCTKIWNPVTSGWDFICP